MTIKRKDFQKAAALIHEFLLKLDFEDECAELRDALNLALLHMQRYYRLLKNRMQNIDKSNGSVMAQSIRGLSPMTPFKDAPDKFQWKWFNLDSQKVANNLPADVHKELSLLPDIILAAKQGNDSQIMELIERDPDCIFNTDGLGRSALSYAVHFGHLDTMQILLENGIDINGTAHDGSTAAHRACHDGNHEALQILISYGADLSVADTLGRYPVHWACATTNRDCLRLLVRERINVNVRDREGMSPSMWACRMDHIEHFELLSQVEQQIEEEDGFERDNTGKTWMHWSVRRTEPLECLRTLLTEDAATLRDEDDKSVMHTCAESGSTTSAKVIIEIAGKQCFDHRDKDDRTPLILASMCGHGEIINYMLSEGADPSVVDSHGANAWDYARAKQLHYCMLIIASYIRQKAKDEEAEFGPLNGGGLGTKGTFGTEDFGIHGPMESTVNGLNSLQINGDEEQLYYGNKPVSAPQPPSQPRTPRTPRGPNTPRGVNSTTPRGKAVNGWGSMPATPNTNSGNTPRTPRGGHAGQKRLTSGSDSNGEGGEDDGRGRRREGSAGKRRKNEHQTPDRMSVHSVHSSAEFVQDRYQQMDGEDQEINHTDSEYLEGSDEDHAEQEKSVSIADMDVSDFEGGGVEGDDEHTGVEDLEHDTTAEGGGGGDGGQRKAKTGKMENESHHHTYQDQKHGSSNHVSASPRKGQGSYVGNRRSPPPPNASNGGGGGGGGGKGYSNGPTSSQGHPQPSQHHKPHRSSFQSHNSPPNNYNSSQEREPQYRENNYDDEDDERPIPSPRQKSPPFSPNFQPAPLSQLSPPAHLQPLPPPSPGRRQKKKKKKRESPSPQLAPVAGPVPPPRGGSGGAYSNQQPPSHPSSASSHHSRGGIQSPLRGDREKRGSPSTIAQEVDRYSQQKMSLSSQGSLVMGGDSGGRGSYSMKPPSKKHVSSFDQHSSTYQTPVDSTYEHNYDYNGDEVASSYENNNSNYVDPGKPPPMPKPTPRNRKSQKLQPIHNSDQVGGGGSNTENTYGDSRRQYDDHNHDSGRERGGSNDRGRTQQQQRMGSGGSSGGGGGGGQARPLPNGEVPRDHSRDRYLQNGPVTPRDGSGDRGRPSSKKPPISSQQGRRPGKGQTPPVYQKQTPNGRLPPTY